MNGVSLDLDPLSEPERQAYVAISAGVSRYEYADTTGRSVREVRSLLAKAERKLNGGNR
jgi:DNA-binding CsgD family transcriptional regulator